tara:strand:- start:388 stop:738 length:351 start_codon:yes stop_codon:yes gene_type:complete
MNLLLNPKKAILLNSLVLIIIGLLSYIVTSSPTALIPVFFGVLIMICYMMYDKNNKVVAHICIVLILLIFISLFMPLNKRIDANDINGILRISIMQLVSLYSMACFIVSFIKARKK